MEQEMQGMTMKIANKELADDLEKRFRLLEAAKNQVLRQNYSIAVNLLNAVLKDLSFYVKDI